MNLKYEEWIKLLRDPMNINWTEPLTEEEKVKVCSHLPRLAKVLEQEHKELLLLKKITEKIEREAAAKDTELSRERVRMRLRMKLADKKEAKAKEKQARKNSCSKECERCQRKRAKKMMAANKLFDVAKSKDPEFTEEQQQNPEGKKDLFQYLQPDEDRQNVEAEEDNMNEDDGEELGAAAYGLPQCYFSSYNDSDLSEEQQQNSGRKKDLLQYREPDKGNNDDEKEEDINKDDGEELGAAAYGLPQCYFSSYNDSDLSEEQQQNSGRKKDLLQYREPDKGNNDDEKEEDINKDDGEELGAAAYGLPQCYFSSYNDSDLSEEQQQNSGRKKDLLQYREPDKGNNDDEKEEDINEDDGEELGAAAYALPQCYFSPYNDSDLSKNHQQMLEMQEWADQVGNVAEGRYLPPHRFDYDRNRFDKGEEVKSDEDDVADAVQGLLKLLEMSEEPKQYAPASDFSKFLNYKYDF